MGQMKTSLLISLTMMVLLAGCFPGSQAAAASGSTPFPSETVTPGTFLLSFTEGAAWIDAMDAPVNGILEDLGKKTGITMESHLGNEEKITIRLNGVSLEEAIKQLAGNSAILCTKEPGRQSQRISKVVILNAGRANATQTEKSVDRQKSGTADDAAASPKPFTFEFDPSQYMKSQ